MAAACGKSGPRLSQVLSCPTAVCRFLPSRRPGRTEPWTEMMTPKPSQNREIIVRGAREHNLKGIDLKLPRDSLIVMTGLSGSGKSSLAFDTIYAEGQRRYVESLSAYA